MDAAMPMLVAVVYGRREGAVIDRLVATAQARGLGVVGMIQKNEDRPGRTKCDMTVVDITSGREILISESRGEGARGCRLDTGALEEASALMLAELDAATAPDVLILSKFGKQEIAGRGFRQVVEKAIDRGVPVVVGVGEENLPGLRDFGGGLETVVETVAEAEAIVVRIAAAKV
jgi:nucleoside-triphosphatase THEP1